MDSNKTPHKAIVLDDVWLSLESESGIVDVLRGVNLTIDAGQTVGVVGPSGSGKTSLLMIIAGLEHATRGSVTIDGQGFIGLNEDALAQFRRDQIGIVFQSFHLVPTMTALENVALPLELAGKESAFEEARVELHGVDLQHRSGHYPSQLSGGEQQRVALARAFVTKPAILLADEPTGSLDGDTGNLVIELLLDLQRRHGTTLIMVTHAPALAAKCTRIIKLADGRVAQDNFDVQPLN